MSHPPATLEIDPPVPILSHAGKVLVVAAILLTAAGIAYLLVAHGKQAVEAPLKRAVPSVEWVVVKLEDIAADVHSQGVVEAVTETRAASEVGGRIVYASPVWKDGGSFHDGETLLRLDDADYKSALAAAEASLAEARLALRAEEVRADQATRDLKKLTPSVPLNDFASRLPHLKSVAARVAALEAAAAKAGRDLERCVIRAPYEGRIRRTLTNIGSWLAPGTPVAEYFRTTAWQVKLPVTVDDFTVLDLSSPIPVTLTASAGDQSLKFEGVVKSMTGEIDRATRAVHLIADITPGPAAGPLLAPGLYVSAALKGRVLPKVAALPRRCLLPGDEVALIDPQNKLRLQKVRILRSGRDVVYAAEGVQAGDRVLATTLAVLTEGMTVAPVSLK